MWLIQEERVFWTEFIQLYKENPCLWKIGIKEYTDRNKKAIAYDILAHKLRERDATADRDAVTKKINNIRTAFRKEYKKVMRSLESGAVGREVHQPKLWYYDQLLFLKDEDFPWAQGSSYEEKPHPHQMFQTGDSDDDEDIDDNDETNLRPGSSLSDRSQGSQLTPPDKKPRMSAPPTTIFSAPAATNIGADITFTPSTSVMMNPTPGTSASRPMNSIPGLSTDMLLSLIGERVALSRAEDEFEVVGKNVTMKLRKLPENMQIYAEKLIHDVLYQAQIGTLTADTKLTT